MKKNIPSLLLLLVYFRHRCLEIQTPRGSAPLHIHGIVSLLENYDVELGRFRPIKVAMVRDVCDEAKLRALLEDAFPPVPLDAEEVIGGNNTRTFFIGNDEAASIKQLIEGKTWLALDIDLLDSDHDILFFLQPMQFAALLPAFLRVAVTRFEQFEPLIDVLLSLLTRSPSKPSEFDHRISALSSRQRTAVATSVQCLVTLCEAWPSSNPARAVYESYWDTQALPKEEPNG